MKERRSVSINLLTFILIVLIGTMAFGQDDFDMMDMSLDDLLDMEVSVASKNAMSIRETPGIVTVMTKDEIVSSGAADLMEVLRLVPGFEFGTDVSGLTGMTLRGNMGYIGRVLLMIDGQEVNELFYSCSVLDNHYPVDNIQRIEIIRGPGSAIYGGFAELGVINVITKNGADLNGVSVAANYGQMTGTFANRSVTVSAGKEVSEDLMFSASAFLSQANRSNRENPDYYDGSYDMTDNSGLNSIVLNANIKFKGIDARFIYDDYLTIRRDQYDANMLNAYDTRYKTILGEVKYDYKLNDKITITPKYNAVLSTPWQSLEDVKTGDEDSYAKYDKSALRNKLNVTASIDVKDNLNVITGGEFVSDNAKTHLDGEVFWDGEDNISYTNMSGFAQGILQTDVVNMTLGARVDNHSQFGMGFAPRIGFTKAYEKLHMKLLISQAFRTPSIDEIDYSTMDADGEPDIETEVTKVVEGEVGYNFAPGMSINVNGFYSMVDNTILYTVDSDGNEGYSNSNTSGSKGFEVELKVRKDWGFVNLNYSFYSAKGINEVDYYSVMKQEIENIAEAQLAGTSPHKIALNSNYKLNDKLSVSPSFVFMGSKYAYTELDADEYTFPVEQDPVFLLNLFVNYRNLIEGLHVSAGAHNILDAEYNFSQAYNGWHTGLPGEGRRMSVKLTYDLNL